MDLPVLILKKGEERRLRAGHLWVFSNEVDTARSPLERFSPGETVRVEAANGRPLGTGYVNPHSLICARLASRDPHRPWGEALLRERLAEALALRERLFAAPFYRLVYGESDGLPGLVLDRYGEVLVAQLNTAGMEARRAELLAALVETLAPRGILLRNDSSARQAEGLPGGVEVAWGEVPDHVEIEENGARFRVPVAAGQKTGWYFDHRLNRARALHYVAGARVLDVFSYQGAWGVQAARAGAAQVLCIESSAAALAGIAANAELNGVGERVRTLGQDAFDALKALRARGERYDVVMLDPPAFVKRRKDVRAGIEAYQRLNGAALQLLAADGILVSSSCSSHLAREDFLDLLRATALHHDRTLRILEQGHQGPDHPVHPSIAETDYLKCFICRVTGRS